MTVQEFYLIVEGNYEDALARFLTEERVKKYLEKFLASDSFATLCAAMDSGDYTAAFKAVHGMKGITANLSLDKLYHYCVLLTEELRGGSCSADALQYFELLKKQYATVKASILALI